jgi:Fic family protein
MSSKVVELDSLKSLAVGRLAALRKVATIESIGSSTRIEGAKLSDRQVRELLSRNLKFCLPRRRRSSWLRRGDGLNPHS